MNRKNTYSRSNPAMSNMASKKQYSICFRGMTFKGTPESVARWYCLRKGIRLYWSPVIEPSGQCNTSFPFSLIALIPNEENDGFDETVISLAGKNYATDFESGYRLFFDVCLDGEWDKSDSYIDFEVNELDEAS